MLSERLWAGQLRFGFSSGTPAVVEVLPDAEFSWRDDVHDVEDFAAVVIDRGCGHPHAEFGRIRKKFGGLIPGRGGAA